MVAVYFSPNDLTIVSGGPSERRDFMDTDISMLSGSYYNLILRFILTRHELNPLKISFITHVISQFYEQSNYIFTKLI